MDYLKGKSELMIFDKHANLKYKFKNRHFWSKGYYLSTVGLNLFVVWNILLLMSVAVKLFTERS